MNYLDTPLFEKITPDEYQHIVNCFKPKACQHHTRLVENMLTLLAQKAIDLSERIDILSRRTTREKLLSYFSRICQSESQSFVLPLSYSALADYLCVDRSAMMREIKKLKDEGIIKTQKRKITIVKDLYL